jgi:hypothetical protein
MRLPHLKIILWTVFAAIVFGIVGAGVAFYLSFNDTMHDVYIPGGAARLVIEHMKANNGAWPRSWEELHETFLSVQEGGSFGGFYWEEYPRRVGIDFAADPAKLATAKEKPDGKTAFRVVWSLAAPETEKPLYPNRMILHYLKERFGDSGHATLDQQQGSRAR